MSVLDYFDFRDDMSAKCEHCGWTGRGGDTLLEWTSEAAAMFDRECPECFHVVFGLLFPTEGQIRAAAEAGNEEAIRMCRLYAIDFTPAKPH